MCKSTGSTDIDYILRENNMENYDYLTIFIIFLCAWLLVLKN
jgi:hypothetical protein